MSSFFKTWDEIAEYVTNTKGYEYLTNPKSWIDAFKDVVGDSRYIGVEDGEGVFYNPNGWIGVGKTNTPSLTSGAKNPPSVNTIVTDTVTGGAVAGAEAVATEQLGLTITLTGAGVIATCLVAFGIGVSAYELAPEFWTDMSNAMFEPITGHHLTYDETEPFLRKKINTWLSTDENGKPLTYVPEEIVQRGYEFLKQHINISGEVNNFPNATFDAQGHVLTGSDQELLHNYTSSIKLSEMQNFVDQIAYIGRSLGYSRCQSIDVTDLYNRMQSDLDLTDYDYVSYHMAVSFDDWNNGFVKSGVANISSISVNAYRRPAHQINNDYVLAVREKAHTEGFYNFCGTTYLGDEFDVRKPDISASLSWLTVPEPATPIEMHIDVKQRTTAMYTTQDSFFTPNIHHMSRYVGLWCNQQPDGINGQPTNNHKEFHYSNPIEYESAVTDEYLQRNNVKPKQGARVPDRNKSLQERYPAWYSNVKVVSYPDKDKTQKQVKHLPSSTPTGDTNTEKIIKHGVNNDDDNDSYRENQDDNQTGKNTPNITSPDDMNKSIEDVKNDYNESRITPSSTPEPVPEVIDLPNYPDTPEPPTPDTPEPPAPPHIIGVTASGMVSVYNPTKQQLIDFSAWLWSPSFLDNFLKIFANPMDAIIGLHIMYATPVSSGSEHIIAGYLDSNVSSKVVTKQYSELDCGTIAIPECYGNATDYEPYTTIHIYLPFIGIMPLKTNDVMGKQLKLKYGIDALTGTCLAMLTVIKDTKEITNYTFAGNCAVQIPVSGGNYAQMITGLAGFIVAGAGAIASGNPILALGAGASFMSGNVSVQHSGSIGANAGACGIRTPYLIISRKKAYDAQNYQHYYGFPANQHVKLSGCKGYTQVKSCHVESIYRATDNEKKEIESLLKEGVIII